MTALGSPFLARRLRSGPEGVTVAPHHPLREVNPPEIARCVHVLTMIQKKCKTMQSDKIGGKVWTNFLNFGDDPSEDDHGQP